MTTNAMPSTFVVRFWREGMLDFVHFIGIMGNAKGQLARKEE
jgi:hypothetical protein